VKRHFFILFVVLVAAFLMMPARASSHREAPLISGDPLADNTDLYAFVSPEHPDRVVLISNFIPIEVPQAGPNFWNFDPNVLYEIMIDNNGDAVEDITYQFEFTTQTVNPDTFLYNTGQITSLDDPDFNIRQFYTVTRVDGRRRTGTRTTLGSALRVPPVNVGVRSIPSYPGMVAINTLSDGSRVFAGQRDDGFYVDIGSAFDLLSFKTLVGGTAVDGLAGVNVHSIAIEVPIDRLTRSGSRPTSPADSAAVIGVWSTASRRQVITKSAGSESHTGSFVQVSRLGNPLVNELVIPRSTKDAFNALEPTGDGAALAFVLDPEPARLIEGLFKVSVPPPPRNDLVTVFLTGVPNLNQPPGVVASEQMRLNVAVPPAAVPHRLGPFAGDFAGYPNGRRVGDDVVDITLRVAAGGYPLTPAFDRPPNNALGDGVDANDVPYLTGFPFLATPHPGRR
jgi:hypothetical protein